MDYYCHTAFEFTTTELGAQGAVLAGGRYDGLVETMGGPATPGVGWAAGLERLAMLADTPPDAPRPVAVIAYTCQVTLVSSGSCAIKIKIAKAFTKPVTTERETKLIKLPNFNSPIPICRTPVSKVATSKYCKP